MIITIRNERAEDYTATDQVVKSAFADMEFSDQKEHELVSRIRKDSGAFIPELSLVAIPSRERDRGAYSFIENQNQPRESKH